VYTYLDVFDSDEPSKKDDPLGTAKVDLTDVFTKEVVEKTEQLVSSSILGLALSKQGSITF
ncbi:9106_t:CDS:2, partial [Dentiscutata heterogama]